MSGSRKEFLHCWSTCPATQQNLQGFWSPRSSFLGAKLWPATIGQPYKRLQAGNNGNRSCPKETRISFMDHACKNPRVPCWTSVRWASNLSCNWMDILAGFKFAFRNVISRRSSCIVDSRQPQKVSKTCAVGLAHEVQEVANFFKSTSAALGVQTGRVSVTKLSSLGSRLQAPTANERNFTPTRQWQESLEKDRTEDMSCKKHVAVLICILYTVTQALVSCRMGAFQNIWEWSHCDNCHIFQVTAWQTDLITNYTDLNRNICSKML